MKSTLAVVGAIAAVIVLGLAALEWRRYFEPRHADVSRQVFERTPSYVLGKVQYLTRLRAQYAAADSEASRATLRALILDEASAVERDLLPLNLRSFLDTL